MITCNAILLFFCILIMLHDAAAGNVEWCLIVAAYAGYFQNEIIQLLRKQL